MKQFVKHSMEGGQETAPLRNGQSNSRGGDLTTAAGDDDFWHESNHGSEPSNSSSSSPVAPLAASETNKLQKLRCLVFLVLVFAIACAIGVYFYVRNQEIENFEAAVHRDATKVLASLGQSLDFTLGGINALAVGLVSQARSTNQTFPFVTIPDFGVRAGKFLSLAKGYVINTYMYVEHEQRAAWENYTSHHKDWVNKTIDMQETNIDYHGPIVRNYSTWDVLYGYEEGDKEHPGLVGHNKTAPYYLPWWQSVPIIPLYMSPYNWDLNTWEPGEDFHAVIQTHKVTLGYAYLITYGNDTEVDAANADEAEFVQYYLQPGENGEEPVSDVFYPIIEEALDSFNLWNDPTRSEYHPDNYTFAGMVAMSFFWRDMIRNILPVGSEGLRIFFSNPCNPPFTYQIMGPEVEWLGTRDYTDPAYDHLAYESPLLELAEYSLRATGYSGAPLNREICPFTVKVSASQHMEDSYRTNNPVVFSATAGVIFIVFAAAFFIYDVWVERRQQLVMERAQRSTAIVSAMFPESVAKRLIGSTSTAALETSGGDSASSSFMSQKKRVKTFLSDGEDGALSNFLDEPIADLFPFTTVLVADIRGFAAWTSSRDPSQVFVLLETIFKAFDLIAKRRKVFKVETVGDRYVAVSGLPDPQERHALIMARFAWDCLTKFSKLCSELEVRLGPETSSLALRIGLHSGPVTAGVLRVDRSRFQLFGDTCNVASQMEATGAPNRIHVSHSTANYLIASGKKHWLTRRIDADVEDKGKGIVTYWLVPKNDATGSEHSETSRDFYRDLPDKLHSEAEETKRARLCDWMVKLLLEHIRLVGARRAAAGNVRRQPADQVTFTRAPGQTCLDEVQDVIKLPKFDAEAASRRDISGSEIPSAAVEQLEKLVSVLSATYRPNQFHNFEHACHVTQSVDKFLKRIVNADVDHNPDMDRSMAYVLHDYTHGITSDPLTILAIVFSALIHDTDHRGISNMQLCKEDEELARIYRSQSVAEQNSLDLSWALLMDAEFVDLRACMFANQEELLRFRQVVVNVVLATDIFDKELNDLRKKRWNRAFAVREAEQHADYVDTRATIVIEHIIQASDVSHTMQHWEIYRRWNEKLFAEMTDAYKAGRMGKDPATFWYQGEIGFFDNYIIPLAMKLKECNVFGVSSDECLNYAQKNRAEWERCGQEIVATMVEKYCHRSASPGTALV